jgi:chemotaxis signal transduction protein
MAEPEANVPTGTSPVAPIPGRSEEEALTDLGDSHTFLIFRDGRRLYAIDASAVHLLAEAETPVWVPSPNKMLLGVIHLHGQFVPMFNLKRLLGIEEEPSAGPAELLEARLIVLEIDGRKLAFTVPVVIELVEVHDSSIHPMSADPEGLSTVADSGLLTGFFEEAAGVITVIDARKLLGALKAA